MPHVYTSNSFAKRVRDNRVTTLLLKASEKLLIFYFMNNVLPYFASYIWKLFEPWRKEQFFVVVCLFFLLVYVRPIILKGNFGTYFS